MNTKNETPESAKRYTQQCAEMALIRLNRSTPEDQARAIAVHYTSMATVALSLQRLINSSEGRTATPETALAIQRLSEVIRTQHLHDFGIELEWRSPDIWSRTPGVTGVR